MMIGRTFSLSKGISYSSVYVLRCLYCTLELHNLPLEVRTDRLSILLLISLSFKQSVSKVKCFLGKGIPLVTSLKRSLFCVRRSEDRLLLKFSVDNRFHCNHLSLFSRWTSRFDITLIKSNKSFWRWLFKFNFSSFNHILRESTKTLKSELLSLVLNSL